MGTAAKMLADQSATQSQDRLSDSAGNWSNTPGLPTPGRFAQPAAERRRRGSPLAGR